MKATWDNYLPMYREWQEEHFAPYNEPDKPEPEVECECGWQGQQADLHNPNSYGDDIYIEGECCPKCGSKNVGDIK